MRSLEFSRHAFGLCAAVAMLAGCDGSSPMGAPSVMQQSVPVGMDATQRNANHSYLYVAYNANRYFAQVDILLRNDLPTGIVKKISNDMQFPDGIFVDSSGTLYVPNEADSGHDIVTVYEKGERRPTRIYRGIGCAFDVVAAPDGTVYVADPCGVEHRGTVHVYAPGGTKQVQLLHPHCAPYSLTLDTQANLYVACLLPRSYWSQVKRFRPGATEGVDLLPSNTVFFVGGIALDNHGALLVEDGGRSAIDVFTAERQPPSRVIDTGQTLPYRFAFDRAENRLYVTSLYLPDERPLRNGPKRPNTVVVLDYPSGTRISTLRNLVPSWAPSGIAVYPPAPFGPPF